MELEYVISKKLQLKMKAEVCYKEKALISKLLFLFITIFFILSYKNDTMDETVYWTSYERLRKITPLYDMVVWQCTY